jgi:hypothetical protein
LRERFFADEFVPRKLIFHSFQLQFSAQAPPAFKSASCAAAITRDY